MILKQRLKNYFQGINLSRKQIYSNNYDLKLCFYKKDFFAVNFLFIV